MVIYGGRPGKLYTESGSPPPSAIGRIMATTFTPQLAQRILDASGPRTFYGRLTTADVLEDWEDACRENVLCDGPEEDIDAKTWWGFITKILLREWQERRDHPDEGTAQDTEEALRERLLAFSKDVVPGKPIYRLP